MIVIDNTTEGKHALWSMLYHWYLLFHSLESVRELGLINWYWKGDQINEWKNMNLKKFSPAFRLACSGNEHQKYICLSDWLAKWVKTTNFTSDSVHTGKSGFYSCCFWFGVVFSQALQHECFWKQMLDIFSLSVNTN